MRASLKLKALLGSAALMFALAPAAMQAQERTLFTWNGRAGQTVDVSIRGGSVSERVVATSQARGNGRGGQANGAGSVALQSSLPQQDGFVRIATSDNQGASVIQQPSSTNGYTAIVRLGGGNGRGNGGQVTAYWSPATTNGNTRVDRNTRNRDDRGRRDSNRTGDNRGTYGNGSNGTYANDGGYGNGTNANGGYGNGTNGNGGYGNRANTLHWYGDVDGMTQLSLRGAQLTITNVGGGGSRNVAGNDAGVRLPSRATNVSVAVREGRGNVTVVQQPTAANGYTAIVRVVDSPSGYGHYDFDITWR